MTEHEATERMTPGPQETVIEDDSEMEVGVGADVGVVGGLAPGETTLTGRTSMSVSMDVEACGGPGPGLGPGGGAPEASPPPARPSGDPRPSHDILGDSGTRSGEDVLVSATDSPVTNRQCIKMIIVKNILA